MKKNLSFISIILIIAGMNIQAQENNNFYDDEETYYLAGPLEIEITGEVKTAGRVDLRSLTERSVIIKEAVTHQDSNRFTGAYRYDGYSLFDILNEFLPDKNNQEEFGPIIDLFVEVANEDGESVILSWGEIYYPAHLHEIIIATSVMRIVPSKTKELWPLPEETKLIVGHDLLTERNITSPSKIIVHSASRSFQVNRDLDPLYSSKIVCHNGEQKSEITAIPEDLPYQHYESVFYGRGRGIHSTTPFHGAMLKDVLPGDNKKDKQKLQKGYYIIAAADGYRCVYSYSEIFNRNDQSEVLLIEDRENMDGGAFRFFPAADFFSDRAIKAVSEIWFEMAD
jgi:hypothetical protein